MGAFNGTGDRTPIHLNAKTEAFLIEPLREDGLVFWRSGRRSLLPIQNYYQCH
ncbi:MAG: hypothetical protein MUF49_20755 [Oculatellaceae cyanobacterium Prado106]|nr:hypothetical protein [Oculatellaceae cyanobacterium Prado106]